MVNLIRKFLDKRKPSPCFFIYKTKHNENILYMNDKLNRYEKEHNKLILTLTSIETIKHGKQLFFRFLKNNNMFSSFMKLLHLTKCRSNVTLESIIMYEFITPFNSISYTLRNVKDKEILYELKKFNELSLKWEKFLHSIGYI